MRNQELLHRVRRNMIEKSYKREILDFVPLPYGQKKQESCLSSQEQYYLCYFGPRRNTRAFLVKGHTVTKCSIHTTWCFQKLFSKGRKALLSKHPELQMK